MEDFIKINEHLPIYKEFVNDKPKYDLEDCEIIDGIMWKTPIYYFNDLDKKSKHSDKNMVKLKKFRISENMDLCLKSDNQIIKSDNQYLNTTKLGVVNYRFCVYGSLKRIKLQDLLAYTFLKVSKNPVTSVHLKWNKKQTGSKYYKYKGQQNHYTNMKILYEKDFKDFHHFKISSRGDLYSIKVNVYKLLTQNVKDNGLLYVENSSIKKNKWIILHEITAQLFVTKENKSYKYLFHRDGDLTNNDYRNLIWTNSLTGKKGDKIMYFSLSDYPDYVISEHFDLFSYKKGTLYQMTLFKTPDKYFRVDIIKKNGQRFGPLFHRLIASLKPDFDPNLVVDHIDNNRQNNHPSNLRCVTLSINNKNCVETYIRGKKVIQIDLNYNVVYTFNNCVIANNKLNIGVNNIRKCARKNDKFEILNCKYTSGGFYWKYVDQTETYIKKEGEEFKKLKGTFQGVKLDFENYILSNYGTVINIDRSRIKKLSHDRGYWNINLNKNNKIFTYSLHVLVALLFVPGKTIIKNQVNHIDEDKNNYNYKNLEWMSQSENIKHSIYKQCKAVKQININTGKLIFIHQSRADAGRSLNKSSSVSICLVINGKAKSAYGFLWENATREEYLTFVEENRSLK